MPYDNWNETIKTLSFDFSEGEYIELIAVNKANKLLVFSNKGRAWESTNAPIEHFDMVEI